MLRFVLLLFLSSMFLNSCAQKNGAQSDEEPRVEGEVMDELLALDSSAYRLNADTGTSYKMFLAQATDLKYIYSQAYKNAKTDSAREAVLEELGQRIERSLVQGLFPFWYGTKWDFNGISNVPGQGQIACGYFVSTTLKHLGMNVNRYKLAQQSSSVACKLLSKGDSVHRISPKDLDEFKKKTKGLKNGLYCVGLDYHVGYLLKREGKYFFIHSSYVGTDGVTIEPIEESPAFYSQTYYIAALTTNPRWLKLWLNGERLLVNGK